MDKKLELLKAFKESITDTGVGLVINLVLNYFLISVGLHYDWSALKMTVIFTTIFTLVAIVRKTLIRFHFAKRYHKSASEVPVAPK
jgi:O-antigen/teichoic acid export membrane protein